MGGWYDPGTGGTGIPGPEGPQGPRGQDGEDGAPGLTWNAGSGTAAPTAGTFAVGDIWANTDPQPGGNIGWVCTSAGTPGTWYAFGSISAE